MPVARSDSEWFAVPPDPHRSGICQYFSFHAHTSICLSQLTHSNISGITTLLLATVLYSTSSSRALYSIAHEHVRSYYNFPVFACRVHLWSVSNCKKGYLIYSAVPCMYSRVLPLQFSDKCTSLSYSLVQLCRHCYRQQGNAVGFFVGWRMFNGIFNRAATAKSSLVLTTHTCRTDLTFRGKTEFASLVPGKT